MDTIEELLTRGVDTIYPSKEELEKVLRNGKKLTLYQGFDPTGTQLHLGHMVGLRKLRQWQDLGHHVIFLIGDFTAMVGDPSGKLSARKILSHNETLRNAKGYKEQAGKILNFEGENPAEVLFNGEWLGKISAIELLRIAGLLSVQQVVERDMFQERQKRGEDIYMNEFLYPVMQAYDCVAMNVDVEVGGTDQTFNMLMGRKLMRHMLKKDKFVMTTPLLVDSQGNKIGKTEGNVIALTDAPDDLFGKIMALSDDVVLKGFEYVTDVPMEAIRAMEKGNPLGNKKRLAFEIVKQLHGEQDAKAAQEYFERTVQQKEIPISPESVSFSTSFVSSATVAQGTVEARLASSLSEAKRLIDQKGITFGSEIPTDPSSPLSSYVKEGETIARRGKRIFKKIKLEPASSK